MFLEVREQAFKGIVADYEGFFAGALDARQVRSLATLTMAAADGLFIAHEVEQVNLAESFELLAAALLGAAEHLRSRSDRSRKEEAVKSAAAALPTRVPRTARARPARRRRRRR
jgi:hypothetical protein